MQGTPTRRSSRLGTIALLVAALTLALLPPAGAQTPDTVEVTLVATNDFHGRIGDPEAPTAAFLATQIQAIRADAEHSLFVDAGDLVGASPVLSSLFYDEPTVEIMNEIGLDVQAVGNHEFDRGQDEIMRRLEGGCLDGDCSYRDDTEFAGQDFTTLAANVETADGEPLLDPYEVRAFDDVSIGFIGIVTHTTPEAVHPDGIQGLSFLDESETVNRYVPELEEQGVDAIVVLMHEGGRQDGDVNSCEDFRGAAQREIAEMDEGVDVVVSAHTHEGYICDLEGGPLVTSARQYAEYITEITLTISPTEGVVDREAVNHELDTSLEPHPGVLEIIEFYDELAGPELQEIVGVSTVPIPRTTREAESAQGNLATDALLDQFEADFAFQNSGGLRADLTTEPDEDGNYPIRREDVLAVWPFGNTVALADIDGTQLEAFLANGVREIGGGRFIQVAGLRIEYAIDPSVDPEDNNGFPRGVLVAVEYWNHPDHEDGTPVDLSADATYTIATNDFMAVGGDGYPDLTDDITYRGEGIEFPVEAYLQANSPVSPTVEGRITEVALPPAAGDVGPAVFRAGTWYLREGLTTGTDDATISFGRAGDWPLMCDFDGDGVTTPVVVRAGEWFVRDDLTSGPAHRSFVFGRAGDRPVCGDWDGDGTDTPAVVRGATWYLNDGVGAGHASVEFTFGRAGDRPVVGDWDGDGTDTPGVVRGAWWYLDDDLDGGDASIEFAYGRAGDRPVVGDWDGDGADGIGVTRGAFWLLRDTPSAGFADASFEFGRLGDQPLAWRY